MSFFNFNSYKNNNSSSSANSVSMSSYINNKLEEINNKYFKNKNIEKLKFHYNDENNNININNKIDVLHLYKTEQNKLNYYFLNNFSNDFLKKVFSISNSNLIYNIFNIYRLILKDNNEQRQKKNLAPIIDIDEYIYFIINNNENIINTTFNSTNDLLTLIDNIKTKNINSIGFYKNNGILEYTINKLYSYDYYIYYYLIDSDTFEKENEIFNNTYNPINIKKLEGKMLRDLTRADYKIIKNNDEINYKLNLSNQNINNQNIILTKTRNLQQKFIDDLKQNISIYLKTNNTNLINNTCIKILQSIYQVLQTNIYSYINNIYIAKYFFLENEPIKFNANKISYIIIFKENNILIESKCEYNSVVLDVYSKININFIENTLNEEIKFIWKDNESKKNTLFKGKKLIQRQIYNILKLNNKKLNEKTVEYIRNKIINSQNMMES